MGRRRKKDRIYSETKPYRDLHSRKCERCGIKYFMDPKISRVNRAKICGICYVAEGIHLEKGGKDASEEGKEQSCS